jgi:hypothetical protein
MSLIFSNLDLLSTPWCAFRATNTQSNDGRLAPSHLPRRQIIKRQKSYFFTDINLMLKPYLTLVFLGTVTEFMAKRIPMN